jgi:hypothetical protein
LLCEFDDDSSQFQNALALMGYVKVWDFAREDPVIEHKFSCRSLSVSAPFCFLVAV